MQSQWEGWTFLKLVLAPGIQKELNGPPPQGSGANKNRSPGSFLGSSLSFCYRSVLLHVLLAMIVPWLPALLRGVDTAEP